MRKDEQLKLEKLFDQTLDMVGDEAFLSALSDLIFEITGNVNVRMRLSGPVKPDNLGEFQEEVGALINKYSLENASNTPDFVLAAYLSACMVNFNTYVGMRDAWYGNNIATHNDPNWRLEQG